MKLRTIGEPGAALALVLILAGCGPASSEAVDPVPPQAVQPRVTALADPHSYLQLTDLAAAIRKAGHPCEVVKSYKKIAETKNGRSVYKIDCLEYSFRLTMLNGQSRLERFREEAE